MIASPMECFGDSAQSSSNSSYSAGYKSTVSEVLQFWADG